jgi:hypothetical protein
VSDLAPGTIRQIRQENLLDQRLWESWKDAEHQPAHICPRALCSPSGRHPIRAEAVRFVSQIARRIQRRFGSLKDYRSAKERLAQAEWDSTPSLSLKQGAERLKAWAPVKPVADRPRDEKLKASLR